MIKSRLKIFFVITIFIGCSFVAAQTPFSKKGGIYFRVDDNQPIEYWREYSKVFDKYGFKFGFALNLGLLNNRLDYFSMVRDLQRSGHEFQDHTPNHRTSYFTDKDANLYVNHPAVDHINGDTVCFKIANLDISKNYSGEGLADVSQNIAISKNNGGFKLFGLQTIYSRIYFPTLNLLCAFSEVSAFNDTDVDTLILLSNWQEQVSITEQNNIPFQIVSSYEIEVPDDGVALLAAQTIKLSEEYNIERPYTFIQPGGLFTQFSRNQVKRVYGDRLGYTAGAVAKDPALKAFEQYNPQRDKRFGMDWGDFYEDSKSYAEIRKNIADRIAKHQILSGHSHFTFFTPLLSGWEGYITRMDSLLQWCKEKNISIKTQNEWAHVLYDIPQNPFINIIPRLNVDLDENLVPDGYYYQNGYTKGVLDTTDGAGEDGNYSYSSNQTGTICEILTLAGLENGETDFAIWTKGSPGNAITVKISFPENSTSYSFKFPAESAIWKKYSLAQTIGTASSLYISDTVSYMNIQVILPTVKNGPVKISGMELRKKIEKTVKIFSTPINRIDLGKLYEYQIDCYSQHQGAKTTISADILPEWLSLHNNTLSGVAPNQNGVYPVRLIADNSKEEADTQSFFINVENISRLSINTKGIDLGKLGSNDSKDTTLLFANIGEDTLIISDYKISGSTLECSIPKIIPPGKVEYIPIRIKSDKLGAFTEKIFIYTNGNDSPEDTVKVEGFIDTINYYGEISELPKDFSLSQNYPNPFNAGTVINYAIKTQSNVTLEIFNVLGQVVNTHESSQIKSPGYYQFKWKGDGNNGSSLGTGVYFIRMTAIPNNGGASQKLLKKMLLIR